MTGPTNQKNCTTFGSDTIVDTDSKSLLHFPHHCRIGDFRRLEFLIQSMADFHHSRRNDCRGNKSTTLWQRHGRHPDQMWINPEMWIWITDHILL